MSSETRILSEVKKGSVEANTKDGESPQKVAKEGEEKKVLFEDGEQVQVENTIPVKVEEGNKIKPLRFKKYIPTFDPFCCTMGNRNLRTCCIVIGIMELVLCIVLIVYLTFEDFKISDTAAIVNEEYKNEIEWKNNILQLQQIMWSILCSFVAVGGMMLVIGAVKRMQIICLLHSFSASICFLVTFINLILYTLYYANEGAKFTTVVAFFLILSLDLNFPYFTACSLGLYTQLRDGNAFENAEGETVDAVDKDASNKVELDDDTTTTDKSESHSHSHRKKRSKMPRRSILERGDLFINRPSVYA